MSKRILVVEDQEDNRQILRDLLGSAGYAMSEAGDGEAGVAAAKAQRPDLILMDIQLPLLDGYEATRRIKADPDLKAIPIIVVTSYALSGDEASRVFYTNPGFNLTQGFMLLMGMVRLALATIHRTTP